MTTPSLLKEIPGFEYFYACDADGYIYSLSDNHGSARIEPLKLKFDVSQDNRSAVSLFVRGKRFKKTAAYLVCLAFHGKPTFKRSIVEHINGDKADNRADNLRWGVRPDTKKGTPGYANYSIKQWNQDPLKNRHTKLNKVTVIEIFQIINRPDHPSYSEMAKKYKVSPSHIASIKVGRVWSNVTDKL